MKKYLYNLNTRTFSVVTFTEDELDQKLDYYNNQIENHTRTIPSGLRIMLKGLYNQHNFNVNHLNDTVLNAVVEAYDNNDSVAQVLKDKGLIN